MTSLAPGHVVAPSPWACLPDTQAHPWLLGHRIPPMNPPRGTSPNGNRFNPPTSDARAQCDHPNAVQRHISRFAGKHTHPALSVGSCLPTDQAAGFSSRTSWGPYPRLARVQCPSTPCNRSLTRAPNGLMARALPGAVTGPCRVRHGISPAAKSCQVSNHDHRRPTTWTSRSEMCCAYITLPAEHSVPFCPVFSAPVNFTSVLPWCPRLVVCEPHLPDPTILR